MLIESIKIVVPDLDNGRITLSEGTTGTDIVNQRHHTGESVIIPNGNWHEPDANEYQKLVNDDSNGDYEQVAVLKLDEGRVELLKTVNFEACGTRAELDDLLNSTLWNQCRDEMKTFAAHYQIKDIPQIDIGLVLREGNLSSTTINTQTRKYIGLHLDSWEKVNLLKERPALKNRICFNLGKYPRYFCFLNVNLGTMYGLTTIPEKKTFDTLGGNEYGYYRKFFSQYPDYKIVRVKVDPYEAYIAPTESVFHDGNSEGNRGVDISYTLRSYYMPRAK